MLFSYANTVVAYFYEYVLLICYISAGGNIAFVFTILNGIIRKINEYLPYLFLVGKYGDGKLTPFFDAELYSFF